MVKHLLTKSMLLLAALVAGSGSAWADYVEVYTLDGTITGGSSDYAVASEITQNEMGWTVVGNTTTNPWRIGGKSLTNVDRDITGLTSFSKAISKITFNHAGTTSDNMIVNSATLTVSSKNDFSTTIDEVELTPSISKNTSGSFNFVPTSPLTEWAKDSYYKITINVSNSKSSNYAFTLTSVVFYETVSKAATTTTIDATGITNTNASVSTVAGQLTATVTSEGSPVEGATVTWTSSDTDVATVDASGNVTLVADGTTTITASYAGDEDYSASSDTYELVVSDPRTETGLAYGEDTQTISVGETLDAPTLTNPNGLSVSYSSSDEEVATVDASGNVTGVAVGVATITASFAGNETYKAGSASYTINVKKATLAWELFYEGVSGYTSTSDGSSSLSTSSSNLDSDNWNSFSSVYSGKVISGDENGHLKFGSGSNVGTAVTKSLAIVGTGKLTYKVQRYDSSNAGNLQITVTGATATGDIDVTGTAAWVEKTVLLKNATGDVVITFATTSSNKRIRVDDITVTQVGTITVAEACTDGGMYYGTYSNSKAFVVPSDIEVSEVGVTDGKLALTAYNTGDVVPANTGVLITALEAGDYIVDYSAAAGTSVLGSDNKLKASGDAGISAEDMNEANTKFYRLTMHDGSKLGFWWGAEEGTAFDIAANKAYLAVPDIQAANVQGFVFGDETTGLSEELRVKSEEFAPVVYDLQGRRVAQTAKGLYIVNGKKVIIK